MYMYMYVSQGMTNLSLMCIYSPGSETPSVNSTYQGDEAVDSVVAVLSFPGLD